MKEKEILNESAKTLSEQHHYEKRTAIAHVRTKGYCEYCGEDLLETHSSYCQMQIDHLLPKSKFNESQFGSFNFVTSCPTCNQLKRDFNPLEDGEDPHSMLNEHRGSLIEKAKTCIKQRKADKDREFKAVKSIIRSD